MPRVFYVLRDDRGRWAISNAPIASDQGPSFRSSSQALDYLRNDIEAEGLVMGRPIPEGMGFRVEALEPADPRPMLYSADALKAIEFIKEKFAEALQKRALAEAKQDGRRLVADEDVFSALKNMSVMTDLFETGEEDGNG
jgi:hypothetical protein